MNSFYNNRPNGYQESIQKGLSAVRSTNVDHQFQRAGFDKKRLFYTQGDYGLFQSVHGRDRKMYDNEAWVMKAISAQRFLPDESGVFQLPKDHLTSMRIPSEMIPHTPNGGAVTMNLRSDDTFVEDDGWHAASANYAGFLKEIAGKHVLYLEIGVGANTPVLAAPCTKDTKKHRKTADLNHLSHNPVRMSFRRCA